MGASGRWIKALVGFTKSDKSKSSKKDENVSTFMLILIYKSVSLFYHNCDNVGSFLYVCLIDEGEGCV